MLPRPKSIFDDADFCKAISTGAPPRYGPGSGFLYIVTKSLMVKGRDQGPGVLLVQEYMPGGRRHLKWGPPGGQSDKTDHSACSAEWRGAAPPRSSDSGKTMPRWCTPANGVERSR